MRNLPTVTRYLLIANVAVFLLQQLAGLFHADLADLFGLHFVLAENFRVFQPLTYMFLHANLMHLFFNMLSLWMFGGIIERTLGARKFLLYFLVCGVGAGLCQELFQTADYLYEGLAGYDYVSLPGGNITMAAFLDSWNTIGASGACYGVLLAFGMLYPEERIMLLLPPIPMKAKYFVAGYAVIELFSAYSSNDNIAHFAHLGGMLFGWLLLLYWRRRPRRAETWGGWTMEPRRKSAWRRLLDRLTPRKKRVSTGNARHTATRESDYDFNMRRRENEARMDEILDKVRRSGYDSLSPEEKRELYRLSRK